MISTKKNYCSIVLNQLELSVYLGQLLAERRSKQVVSLSITIQFLKPLRACTTDKLKDTDCYDQLITAIKKNINKQREFRLLEHLGYEVYKSTKQFLSTPALVHICITKKPAIPNLIGGVSFYYGDK